MPSRMLREGILTSERVNRLGWEAEVFYRRLMSVVDDYGRFHAHSALLRAALYPLKLDTMRDAEMDCLLAEVEAAGLVRVYQTGGKRYVEILDFRQRVRAQESKFPPPNDSHPPPVGQMPSVCLPSAGLGGGADEDEVVSEGEGGGENARAQTSAAPPPVERTQTAQTAAAAPPPSAKDPTPAQTPGAAPLHVQIAVKLREGGVNITSAHPHAQAWAARGLTVQHAMEALALARLRKPEGRIAPNYLAPIVDEMLAAGMAPPRKIGAPAWWASEAATVAKGRELALHPHPGEGMNEYRARLSAAIARHTAHGPSPAHAAARPASAAA